MLLLVRSKRSKNAEIQNDIGAQRGLSRDETFSSASRLLEASLKFYLV